MHSGWAPRTKAIARSGVFESAPHADGSTAAIAQHTRTKTVGYETPGPVMAVMVPLHMTVLVDPKVSICVRDTSG